MKKMLFTVLLLVSAMLFAACSSEDSDNSGSADGDDQSEGKTMRLAVVTSEDRSLTQGLYHFGEIVEEETGGSINVEVYPSGQLGGDREVFEGLQMNTIQGSTMSTGPIANFDKTFEVFDLPYLFPDKESAYEVLDGETGSELLDGLTEQNVIGVNFWENGFRQLTNNAKAVESVEDVEGLDIRTLENELHMDMWKELGANPTPVAYTELFVAMEQGTVDGQENPIGNITNDKFYEVQDYLTITNHIYNASAFLISKGFWDTLTDEEKEIMREAADKAKDYQRELNQQESEEGLGILKEEGMNVTELSDEARQDFREAVQPIYDKYESSIGEDFLNKLIEDIEKASE